ncbi:hypothetical protein Tco_0289847 [Tanacetum coccineum]
MVGCEKDIEGGIISVYGIPRFIPFENHTVSDNFIALYGLWKPTKTKLLVISVYAPQALSEKRTLWNFLSLLISRWECKRYGLRLQEEASTLKKESLVGYGRRSDNMGNIYDIKSKLHELDVTIDQGGANTDILASWLNLMRTLEISKRRRSRVLRQKSKDPMGGRRRMRKSKFFHQRVAEKYTTLVDTLFGGPLRKEGASRLNWKSLSELIEGDPSVSQYQSPWGQYQDMVMIIRFCGAFFHIKLEDELFKIEAARSRDSPSFNSSPVSHSQHEEVGFLNEYGEGSRYKIEEVIGKGSYGVVRENLLFVSATAIYRTIGKELGLQNDGLTVYVISICFCNSVPWLQYWKSGDLRKDLT